MVRFKKIILVAGARPNFVKVAPLVKAFSDLPKANKPQIRLVHTGQHYDYKLSRVFFEDLNIPEPDIYLGVGSGSHAIQTAKVMVEFEKVMLKEKPALVIVVGDVNSTLACALTAHKMRISVAHVEAGLRSYDKKMPEEANRVLTDHISDFLFAPSEDAYQNLLREGIDKKKIFIVGNVMIDTLKANWVKAKHRAVLNDLGLENSHKIEPYAVVTLHRPSNVDDPKVLRGIFKALDRISRNLPILYPAHPRTWANIKEFGLGKYFTNIQSASGLKLQSLNYSQYGLYVIEPLRYLDFIKVQMHATAVLTDSGGVQEETAFLGVPCLTLRENTERPITVVLGTNKVIGVDKGQILQAWEEIKGKNMAYKKGGMLKRDRCKIPKWDGKAAERIVKILTG